MIRKNDIKLYNPCKEATDELINKSFGDKDELTEKEVLNLDFLKHEHKLWLFLRPEIIEQSKLDEIKAKFISCVDPSNKFYDLLVNSTIQGTIGKMIRCFRPNTDEQTCAMMMDIVKDYIE